MKLKYSSTFLDLSTRWRRVVSFTPLPLYPRGYSLGLENFIEIWEFSKHVTLRQEKKPYIHFQYIANKIQGLSTTYNWSLCLYSSRAFSYTWKFAGRKQRSNCFHMAQASFAWNLYLVMCLYYRDENRFCNTSYRVSIKSFPDFSNLLHKNYARYNIRFFLQRLPQLRMFFVLH
jgi:hypothetical protein